MQDWNLSDQRARLENAGLENDGLRSRTENAGLENDGLNIDNDNVL